MTTNKLSIINYKLSIVLCLIALASCRPLGDDLLSYGQNDDQAFYESSRSYAGEFKAFWMAMNENYCIWDYEAQFGLDWDEVYATYLPKFEELDKRQNEVTAYELQQLYESITDRLHDGHLTLMIKDIKSGQNMVLQPNQNRLMRERKEEASAVMQNLTSLETYLTPAAGAYQVQTYDGTGALDISFDLIDTTMHRVIIAAEAYVAAVDAAGGPNSTNDSVYAAATRLPEAARQMQKSLQIPASLRAMMKSIIYQGYDQFRTKYSFVCIQIGAPLPVIEKDLQGDDLGFIRYALFDGNIAYLRFGGFDLSPSLDPAMRSKDTTSMYYAYQQAVNRVWHNWFDTIQTLHQAGQLGGIIIDVRNNGGGRLNDYQYVLGALLPSGGYASHTLRTKNGSGRLDFGPLTPFVVPTYKDEHEIINDRPIVVLANCRSISMAEVTTYGVKSQPNGCFIGRRTFGGLSALSADPSSYSDFYSGAFGVQGVTSIWGYVPKLVSLFGDEQQPLEGVGITPDIDTPFDVNLWTAQGRDNQLETAIDYIRSK